MPRKQPINICLPSLSPTSLRLLTGVTLLLFLSGISLPVMTLTKLMLVSNTFSILSGIGELWAAGHYGLFALLTLFSLLLPLAKLGLLFLLSNGQAPQHARWLALMHAYGRWGMLDVMVVALLVVAVKLGALASIQLHAGVYFFAASVLLMMVLTQLVSSALHKA